MAVSFVMKLGTLSNAYKEEIVLCNATKSLQSASFMLRFQKEASCSMGLDLLYAFHLLMNLNKLMPLILPLDTHYYPFIMVRTSGTGENYDMQRASE